MKSKLRAVFSHIKNMCNDEHFPCADCAFYKGQCYFRDAPMDWDIDAIINILKSAESEDKDLVKGSEDI